MRLIVALLPPLIAGYLLVTALWPGSRDGFPSVLIRACLSVGLGFGLSSCVFFVGLLIAGPSLLGVIVGDVVLLGMTISFFVLRCSPPIALTLSRSLRFAPLARGADTTSVVAGGESLPPAESPWRGQNALPWLILILVAAAGGAFITISGIEPHGQWDAWAIWNLKARFIFRGGDQWVNLFTPTITIPHTDYPLLLPATVARLWIVAGRDLTLAPVMMAGLYLAALFGLLIGGLWALKGRSQGLLAGLILVTSHRLITQSSYQYADLPLSFAILAVMVLIALWHEHNHSPRPPVMRYPHHPPESKRFRRLICMRGQNPSGSEDRGVMGNYSKKYRDDNPHGLAALTGLMIGVGAWTKNEGLLFLVIAVGAVLLAGLIRRLPRSVGAFLAGLLPVLAVIILFKIVYAPPNDILSGQGWDITRARLTDPTRYLITARAFISEGLRVGSGGPALLVAYLLLLGVRLDGRKNTVIMLGSILALTLLGYFFIYIITPLDLQTHLDYSIDRLIMHLWPGVLFVFFLVVPTPGEALYSQ